MKDARAKAEIDESRITGYLFDEDDREIGFLYTDEGGCEVERYYDAADQEKYADAEEDVQEVEVDPAAILYYFVDPQGNELGFAARDEAGRKQEYWYPADAVERFFLIPHAKAKPAASKTPVKSKAGKTAKADDAVTKEDLREMFGMFKEVATEGYAAVSGVMDQVDNASEKLEDINPVRRHQRNEAQKETAAAAAKMLAADETERAALAQRDAAERLRKARQEAEAEQRLRDQAQRAAEIAVQEAYASTAPAADVPEAAAAVVPPVQEPAPEPSEACAAAEEGAKLEPEEAPEPTAKPRIAPTSMVGRLRQRDR